MIEASPGDVAPAPGDTQKRATPCLSQSAGLVFLATTHPMPGAPDPKFRDTWADCLIKPLPDLKSSDSPLNFFAFFRLLEAEPDSW